MPFPGDRMPKFIRESSHEKIEAKLQNLSLAHGQKLEIIEIYESRQGGVVAWFFQDTKILGMGSPRGSEEAPVQSGTEEKPKVRRRRRKKAGV